MVEIIPAILEQNGEDFRHKLDAVPPEIGIVHVDVLDDKLCVDVPRAFEVHIMASNPADVFEQWKNQGAKRIIVHDITDSMSGVELGLALEMHVSIDSIELYIGKIGFVQLMSIAEIGEQGHALDERIFDRIRGVKEKFPGLTISVDGGINASNYESLIEAGADRLVVGSGFNELWQTLQMKE
jgi:pentose-5-phosphate-3-epimerase